MTPGDEHLEAAFAERRAVMGSAYVDAALADDDPVARAFQDHVTRQAWGAWARSGPLDRRDRSLLVLAMTAALGRTEEFRLHVGTTAQTGVTDEELDELLFMVAGYCGAPSALAARRELRAVRDARRGEE